MFRLHPCFMLLLLGFLRLSLALQCLACLNGQVTEPAAWTPSRAGRALLLEDDFYVRIEPDRGKQEAGVQDSRGGKGKGSRRGRRRDTQRKAWFSCHSRLVAELEAAEEEGRGFDVILYGDSIFESFRGTFTGSSWSDFAETRQVFEETLGAQDYTVQVAAVAGDTVKRLAWRLRNGELPKKHPPKIVAILIGTNDLSGAACTSATLVARTGDEIEGLLNNIHRILPRTTILLLGILPKGSSWPNICAQAIQTVNKKMMDYAATNAHVHYLDLKEQFLTHKVGKDGKQDLIPSLMSSDSLHPSFYGMRILAKELTAKIREVLLDQ